MGVSRKKNNTNEKRNYMHCETVPNKLLLFESKNDKKELINILSEEKSQAHTQTHTHRMFQ